MRARRLIASALCGIALLAAPGRPAEPDGLTLASQSRQRAAAGDVAGALELAEQARAALGDSDQQAVIAYLEDDSATYLLRLGRLPEALEISKQAVARIERVKGVGSSEYGALAATLGALQAAAGGIDEALLTLEAAYQSLPAGDRKARAAMGLARTHRLASDPEAALEWSGRALEVQPGPELERSIRLERVELEIEAGRMAAARAGLEALQAQPEVARVSLQMLAASLAVAEGRLVDAEQRLASLLARPADLGPDDLIRLKSQLGLVYVLTGRLVEAQEVYRTVLRAATGTGLGETHPAVGRTLHALAITYRSLGDYEEAALLYRRAIDVLSASLGGASEAVARSRLEYARLLVDQGDPEAARVQAAQAVAVLRGLGRPGPLGLANSSLGFTLKSLGQPEPALERFAEALDLLEAADGPWSPDLPPGLAATAELQATLGRSAEALTAIDRAIAIQERIGSTTFSGLAQAYATKSRVLAPGDPGQALVFADRSLDVVGDRLRETADQRYLQEIAEAREVFETYLDVAEPFRDTDRVARRMLLAVQYPTLTAVAASISQVAERSAAAADAELVRLLEERQRLTQRLAELERRQERKLAGLAASSDDDFDEAIADVRAELDAVGARIEAGFPAFAERAFPRPVALDVLQARLRPEEAAMTLLSTDVHTFVFLVRPDALRIARVDADGTTLRSLVTAIRRSVRLEDAAGPPPFDRAAAHRLYRLLLGPFESELRDVEHLIYVPDITLISLPLGLLVTTSQAGGDPAYLQQQVALSTMPSFSALVALRSLPEAGIASLSMLGIGHPVLGKRTAAPSRSAPAPGMPLNTDVHAQLAPLPNTVLEINEIAKAFPRRTTLFQEGASETGLYELENLRSYRVIVFATHGLLRDDTLGVPEPALVLTRDARNDGLLLASEIADLSLDADWVILSACNTAGPDGSPRARGLSGLAKSFFFAGARALLVSHWSVNSTSAVLITTGTMAEYAAPDVGRAEALQRTLVRFIAGEYGDEARHPAYWAPFVLVGDGAV